MSKLTRGMKEEIIALYKKGDSLKSIARKYDVDHSTVSYHLRKAGLLGYGYTDRFQGMVFTFDGYLIKLTERDLRHKQWLAVTSGGRPMTFLAEDIEYFFETGLAVETDVTCELDPPLGM